MDGITDRTTGKKSQEGEGLELYQQASQKLAEILESIRQNAFPVRDAPVSSTSAQEKADLKEDRSRDPVLVSSFGGKKIYAYPKRLAHEIEHRLEWGSKLDLTDEERAYIRSNKNLPTGPLKYFTLRSAPKEIVKRDMKWITATITAIEDAEQYVSISSPSSGPDSVRMDLADFLKNPAVLQADLMQALQDPWISRTVLELGKDYLVRK